MVSHYVGGFYYGFPLASLGRQMLLVLSAYFATNILLRLKQSGRMMASLKAFYVRRWLRLYPVYAIIVLGVGLLLYAFGTPETLLEQTPWHLLYASNYYFFIHNQWSEVTSPWWTLSAIEQFYLIWPLVVLRWKSSTAIRVAYALLVLGIVSNIACALIIPSDQNNTLTLNCLPYLAIGGILALHLSSSSSGRPFTEQLLRHPWWAVGAFTLLWLGSLRLEYLVFGAFVSASLAFAGFTRRVIAHPSSKDPGAPLALLAYFGRASFIIYLIHTVVRHVVIRGYYWMVHAEVFSFLPNPLSDVWLVSGSIVTTLICSALLHEYLEQPFMDLRSRTQSPKPAPAYQVGPEAAGVRS